MLNLQFNFNKIFKVIAIAFLIAGFFAISTNSFAATGILKQINFQGKVVNANGTNVANGNYDFVFSIYTVATAGTAIWTETRTVANQVTVTDGIFRVSLGSITALPGSIDFNTDNIYLGINFNSDGEMTPRVQFTAVPQAFNALKVAGLTVTDTTGTFTLAATKTLTVNNTLTFSGTDATTITFQGTDTYVGRTTTDTLTNKTIGSTGLTFSGAATDMITGSNEDFTLTPNGSGNTIFTSDFNSGVLVGSSGNTLAPLSVSGGIGSNALLILNQTNSGDVLAASASGATKFRIANNGDAVLSAGITLGATNGTSAQCLLGGASASWGSCAAGAGSNWDIINGVITPKLTSTLDFLLGSAATGSAKFAVLNINSGTPTASVSAGTNGGAYITAAGTLQTTANQTLTLGGDSTGNVILAPLNGSGTITFEKGAQDVILAVTAPATTTRTYTIPDFGANDSFVGLAATQALTGKTYNGLTVNTTTGTLAMTNAKTLTVSDSTTLGTNSITLAGGEVITFSATNALSLLTTGTTSVTLPTSGTLVSSVTTGNGVSATNTAGALSFTLGVITPTTVNGLTLTAAATGFTIAGGTTSKTLTVNNTLAFSGTDTSTLNIGAGGTLGSNAFTSTAYAPIASPTFTGTVTIPTPFTIGAVSMTSTGTQLNYLNAATGTTGTTTTNLVFSTSPTLVTPILGAATATSVTSPTYTGAGAVTVSSGGSSGLTFDSASGDITVAANDGLTFAATTVGNNGSRNVTINSGTGGTTATLIVKLDTSGTVVTTDTTTLNNAVGVALNTTTIGAAVRVAINGVVTATADNAVTAGDYIGVGTTTAGRAKSLGTTYPSTSGIQVIGRALGTQATPGSTFLLMLNGLDNNVAAGGGGGYATIQEDGSNLTQRATLNFIGTSITCADNAGLTKTDCTLSAAGGGVSFASGTPDNTVGTNNLIHLQKSGVNKFVVANSGGLSIFGATANVVKTTTGTTNVGDFSLTGSTLTNVTSQNDTITLNEGTVVTTYTSATSTTAGATNPGAGAHSIVRDDGTVIVVHGNSAAPATSGSRWDGSASTMTSVTISAGATNAGAGAISLKRPDGRYLLVHGNATALTSVYDPWNITAAAAGPAICAGATTGTNAFLRPDGKYIIICGAAGGLWGIYDPSAATAAGWTAGTAAAGGTFGAGAHAIQRDDGTTLVFAGGGTANHWIYNPYNGANGTFSAVNPITTNAPTISAGAFSIRRNDGKWLVVGGAINTSTVYDPTPTSSNSGAGSFAAAQSGVGFGPTAALADGAQALWRQDGKYFMIVGSGSLVTNIIDPSVSTNQQFLAGTSLPNAIGAGVHLMPRPDGKYQIVRGGASSATDTLDVGFIIGGSGTGSQLASYETECITTTSLNINSRLFWNSNQEGQITFQAKTGTGACSGAYKDILGSGDLIRPVAGDNRVQIKAFFKRPFPNFADQEWKLWRGNSQTRYRRNLLDPTLHDVSVDNSTQLHRTQFEFGSSSDPSGPVAINMINDRDKNLAIALAMGVGYGSTINATNPQFYNGAFGTHPALATTATLGTVVMRRPDGKFMIISGNTTTANAQLYDPVLQTITAQAGAGNIPTAGTGQGASAFKRPDGKFLLLIGNNTTTTNIYDPMAASGSQFTAGPALTAAGGRGALLIPLPTGRVLIMHGNGVTTSSIYDPIQNTMVIGPVSSAGLGEGSLAIPRPDGAYLVVIGQTTSGTVTTTTNNFDPYTMIFTATGSPAITTGTGAGAHAFQRTDGQWVIVHAGATATTRTQIYNPFTNKSVVGPVTSAVAGVGSHAIHRPDGSWLIVHGGALTTTSIYLEKAGAFTAEGLAGIGQNIAGPALVTAAGNGSISFQRDDGKYVTITGNAGTIVQQYDGGWVANGLYRSEQINVSDLDSNSTLTWKATPNMGGISAEVRTATSQLGLQTATAREIPTSGGSINPGASETWLQINFNFKRTFPSYPGIATDVWYNTGGSSNLYGLRQIATPTLTEFKVNKDVNLVDLKSDGLSMFRVSSSGDIYTSAKGSVNSGGADLAENYTSQVQLEKGEVVSIDSQNNHGVKRTSYQYQPDILGVVSTAPGFVAGAYTKDSYPIALIGRVPVKVSTENGMIRTGDYLTASSVSGYAMKASVAGRVLGKALENLDSTKLTDCPEDGYPNPKRKCGEVMMFVNLVDYLGSSVEMVMVEKSGGVILANEVRPESDSGVVAIAPPQNDNVSKQQQILAFLKQLKEERENNGSQYASEVFTDRVSAVNEIITPHIITELLTAKKIKADSIEGLEILTDKISSLQGQVAGLSTQSDATPSAFVILGSEATPESDSGQAGMTQNKSIEFESGKFTLDLTILGKLNANGGLIVLGLSEFKGNVNFAAQSTFQGETVFEKLVSFVSNVIFRGKVTFEEVPAFNKDTAGSAIITKDTDQVVIVFDKEYEQIPFVTVGITIDTADKNFADKTLEEQAKAQETLENDLLSYDLKYFVTKRDKKGFVIKLNKKASLDVPFSWHAIAVKDSIVFKSKPPVTEPTSTPFPILEPTIEPSITPSQEASSSAQ